MKNKTIKQATDTSANLKTLIHSYSFYINEPEGKAAWLELKAKLEGMGLKCFESCGDDSHEQKWADPDGSPVELETSCLFNNQWNTADGLRVYDWALDYMPCGNPFLKRGHWLEQTQGMRDARHNNVKCGYCGHMQPYDPSQTLCHSCAGSEHLKPEDYPLLRLRRIDAPDLIKYQPLTDAETAELVAVVEPARAAAKVARIAKIRAEVIADSDKEIADAETERDAKLWLLDNGEEIDNVIYYPHTGRFCFGWNKGLTTAEHSHLCELLCEFPFDYDFQMTAKH